MKKALAFIAGFGITFLSMVFILNHMRVMIHGPITLTLCIAGGSLASWFADSPKRALQPIARKWWGANHAFRLSAFAASIWVIGSLIWLDDYDRSLEVVLGPAVAILMVYLGYTHLVVGTKQSDAGPTPSIVDDSTNREKSEDAKKTVAAKAEERQVTTSLDHAKSMDELIRRMKSGS